uniref:DDE-type integrase/transposase/recombinase n=1 Tax=Paraburkholderia ferrariae TaxID=386056 RepID=UPI002ADE6FC8|nr:DDE-type integrase/transposase/recombinase [Paraburkholderia ferrariae]
MQGRRDMAAAKAFFSQALRHQGQSPETITPDGYAVSHRAVREMKRGQAKIRVYALQRISAFRHSSGLYTVQQSSEVATADRCRFARNST